MSLQQLALLFVSFFTLFSPVSNIGPYASMVGGFPRTDQKGLANRVAIVCLAVLLVAIAVQLLANGLGGLLPVLSR